MRPAPLTTDANLASTLQSWAILCLMWIMRNPMYIASLYTSDTMSYGVPGDSDSLATLLNSHLGIRVPAVTESAPPASLKGEASISSSNDAGWSKGASSSHCDLSFFLGLAMEVLNN